MSEPTLSGWGRTADPGRELRSEDLARVSAGAALSRGLGRSYGDASLPAAGASLVARHEARRSHPRFDAETGVLRAEAGLCLAELLPAVSAARLLHAGHARHQVRHARRHGRFGRARQEPPRRRHIGRHVALDAACASADGRVVDCSRELEPELFLATLGGMGLTGPHPRGRAHARACPFAVDLPRELRIPDLDEFLAALKERRELALSPSAGSTRSRAAARSAAASCIAGAGPSPPRRRRTPASPRRAADAVRAAVVACSIAPRSARSTAALLPPAERTGGGRRSDTFFYPLDASCAGTVSTARAASTQHQCVLPDEAAAAGVRGISSLDQHGGGLVPVGDQGLRAAGRRPAVVSVPGISVALDIPIRANTQS